MERRRQSWHMPDSQYQSSNREGHHRSSHQTQYYYSYADPRWRERQWTHVEPAYGGYMSPPPSMPGYSSNRSGAYASNQPQHFRPQPRQEYDFSAASYWPYREDYGCYDPGYHRPHYNASDAVAGWRSEVTQAQGWQQEFESPSHLNQKGFKTDSEYDHRVSERHRERLENGKITGEMNDSGVLADSKASGLSSSSYELSQYINAADHGEPVSHTDGVEVEEAPLKFWIPHVMVSFGPAGQLLRVRPSQISEGQTAQVEMHSLEVLLCDTREQQDMREFPGPLAREDLHKVDAINFALQMSERCLKDEKLEDATSAALLWDLLILLCRQNGRVMGSDVAELLMKSSKSLALGSGDALESKSLIDLSETPTYEQQTLNFSDLLTGFQPTGEETAEQNLQKYTKLLLSGRKKEALESAMESGLWGHALFLASKMDSRSYNTVLSRFTGSLAPSDTLQTLFQLLSGRIPAVSMSWSSEKWGDWRPHLAVLLSNETAEPATHHKSIITLGDTLASKGLLDASHICYLTAQCPFGWYSNRSDRVVLLGSKHCTLFNQFCHNAAIRCTELFEYCQKLGNPVFNIPAFQVYKFLYACRLLECGLTSQAFHYCELVAKAMIQMDEPHTVLLGELIKLVDRLKFSEAQLEAGVNQLLQDPDWLVQIRCRYQSLLEGNYCIERYQPPPGETAWTHEDSNSCSDLTEGSLAEAVHQACSETHTSKVSQTTTPYNDVMFQENYSPAILTYSSAEPAPRTIAPVPMYPTLQPLPPAGPMEKPCFSSMSVVQNQGLNQSITNQNDFHRSSLSYVNTGAVYSENAKHAVAENEPPDGSINQSGPNPTEDKGEGTTQTAKSPKAGWFNGWFNSKPKEEPKKQNPNHMSSNKESPPSFPFPAPPPSTPNSGQPSFNPFSRSAGQSKNQRLMSQGP